MSQLPSSRWHRFRKNKRGFYAAFLLALIFALSLFSECIANNKPILVSYDGHLLTPIFHRYSERTTFHGQLDSEADYRDPWVQHEITAHGWMLWPPIRFDYATLNFDIQRAPSPPSAANLLGTDDQARDVLARVLYGLRISMLFALLLVGISSVLGVAVGALSGYLGGWPDLLMQRFIEIWHGIPVLFLLIILSSLVKPNFWWILGLLLLFSWTALVDVVRAEFLRARNLDYVRAAKAMGAPERRIIFRHMLPNAMVSVFTFLPFLITGAITTLASLDFLGFGLPSGSPSLGELLQQGKNNPQSPWLGLIAFAALAILLSLWLFVGEAIRDAFNPRKSTGGPK